MEILQDNEQQITCEQCKYHYDNDGYHRCSKLHIFIEFADFYCAFATEKKEKVKINENKR